MRNLDSDSDLWSVSNEQKHRFAATCLVDVMINGLQTFPVLLEQNDADLEPVLEWMLVRNWVEITPSNRYAATRQGHEVLERFVRRYTKFLFFFDVFSGVDLGAGTFAFQRYFDLPNPRAWQDYLNQPNFSDLRIAMAEHLGINPVEVVFMNFLREKRFGLSESGWQFDLLLGSVWDEILDVCNNAIDVNDLGYTAPDGVVVAGYVVAEDILIQGTDLLESLVQRAGDILQETPGSAPGQLPVVKPPHPSEFDFRKDLTEDCPEP